MKILIIGASRGTGLLTVKLALKQGHHVTAVAREAHLIDVQHPNLRKFNASFHDKTLMEQIVPGHEAIIITASLSILELKEDTDFYSRGTRIVLEAMRKSAKQLPTPPRIIVLSNLAAGDGYELLNPLAKLFTHLFIREATDDHTEQEHLVRNSGFHWCIARPSRLTNRAPRGAYKRLNGKPVPGSIARADVADFLLDAATSNRWLNSVMNLGG